MLEKAERREDVVVFTDDGPEGGHTQSDVSPFLADGRGMDDAGATAQVAEDMHKEPGKESVDGSQLAPQDADLSPDAINQCFDLGKLQVGKLDCMCQECNNR
jgi:hypothetical protein